MVNRVPVAMLWLLAVHLFFGATVCADSAYVGLRVGDWAKYSVGTSWNSNVPEMTEPQYFQDLRSIEWLRLEVTNTSDASITAILAKHFLNGTEQTALLIGDVETGHGNLSSSFPLPYTKLALKKNLKVGDATGLGNVSETVVQVYANFSRRTACVKDAYSGYGYRTDEYYGFDCETGLLCEARSETSISIAGYSSYYSTSMVLTETGIFDQRNRETSEVMQRLIYVFVLSIVAAFVVSSALLFWKTRRNSTRNDDKQASLQGTSSESAEP